MPVVFEGIRAAPVAKDMVAAVEKDQLLSFPKPLMSAKGGVDPVLWSELELAGRNLLVPDLEWDAHLEALVLDLLHALEGRGVGGQGGHEVVTQLLVSCGELAHDGPPVELQAVGLALGQGAAVKVELELVGGLVKPDHHQCRKPEEAMGWN